MVPSDGIAGGAGGAGETFDPTAERISAVGLQQEGHKPRGWFASLLLWYLRNRTAKEATPDDGNARVRTLKVIDSACLRSALTGATAGLASTGATLFTAQTEGVGAVVAIPIAALTIGAEMALRTLIHVDLICTMADIFGLTLDPTREDDVLRLCALAFGTEGHAEHSDDPGQALVRDLAEMEKEEVAGEIGDHILGESVLRNVLPIIGVATSAITNYRKTKHIGDTARRYFRYQRALEGALSQVTGACAGHVELLVEGMWFVFIADGRLASEESAVLASLVQRLPAEARARLMPRFVEDEYDWLERLGAEVTGDARQDFYRALEVAAAVDKKVELPERRLLRSAARRLGVDFDPARLERMIRQLEDTGLLVDGGDLP
jgi:uncharacterized protein (DUF697 family)